MIVVNGKPKQVENNQTITTLLASEGLDQARVAVELNGSIVPKAAFDATRVHDGDKVEIVHFVGGG